MGVDVGKGVTGRVFRKATPERLSALSDGFFAVLITMLVLDLHPPEGRPCIL
jgi:uncharacterized membrane protein